jgi:hypothetical protein
VLNQVASGVPGLDVVLAGGLEPGAVVVVAGVAGTGKTMSPYVRPGTPAIHSCNGPPMGRGSWQPGNGAIAQQVAFPGLAEGGRRLRRTRCRPPDAALPSGL